MWSEFNTQAEQKLTDMKNKRSHLLHRSFLSYDHRVLNYQWQMFKTAIMKATHKIILKRKVSPYIYQDKSTSEELKHLQLQNSLLNQIYFIIHQFLYESKKINQLQYQWTYKKPASKRTCLLEINSQYVNTDSHLNSLEVLFLMTYHNRSSFENLLIKINSLRKLLKAKHSLLEAQHKEKMVKAYADARCTNFAKNKAAFITFSLNKTQRCIVLDQVMSLDSTGQPFLITDPVRIKQIANLHY